MELHDYPLRAASKQRRDEAFAELVATVQQCRACSRMEGRTRVLSAANGSVDARICFIAEAPGRFGGERTMIPLSGDQSGKNFTRLLEEAGLDRASIFITNAVLCNPQDQQGRNAPPTKAEIRTCCGFLAATLDVLQPVVVVTLGAVALGALTLIEPHPLTLANDCGRAVRWCGRWLVPLYHPSPRAQLSRSFAEQVEDFRTLGALLRDMDKQERVRQSDELEAKVAGYRDLVEGAVFTSTGEFATDMALLEQKEAEGWCREATGVVRADDGALRSQARR